MPPKNSGGSTKFPGGHKVIHRTAQTAFVRVVTPRRSCPASPAIAEENMIIKTHATDGFRRLFIAIAVVVFL